MLNGAGRGVFGSDTGMAEPSGTGPAARLPASGPGWRLAGRGVRLSLREHGKQVSVRTTSDVDQACQEAVLTCTCVAGFQALGDAVGPCRDPRSGRRRASAGTRSPTAPVPRAAAAGPRQRRLELDDAAAGAGVTRVPWKARGWGAGCSPALQI